MALLATRYMGIKLRNPLVVGASSLTSHLDSIRQIEDNGAGGLVVASLFEEQVQLERFKFEEELQRQEGLHAEMTTLFPKLEHAGPEEHLMWVRKAKESVGIPVIGSLNAINAGTWGKWAVKLAQTGVDGLELNFYAVPASFDSPGTDIEREQIEILEKVRSSVSIPVSVKLSPFYTNPLHFLRNLDQAGVAGLVLFNRLFYPDIEALEQQHITPVNYSTQNDSRLALRFAGLLFGELQADICASTGIMAATDVVKMILAGATCVQTVSCLYKRGVSVITEILDGLARWMEAHAYGDLTDFRGKLSRRNSPEPWIYTRAQYAKLLLHPAEVAGSLRGS